MQASCCRVCLASECTGARLSRAVAAAIDRWRSRLPLLCTPPQPALASTSGPCSLLLIRLCLTMAYIWLMTAASVGYPDWPKVSNPGFYSLDGIIW